jgi:hypothetical protein
LRDQFLTNPNDLPGKHVEVLLGAAMIGNGNAQTIAALQSRVGGRGNSLFMELHENLLIQGIELLIVQPAWVEAETNNVQADGRQ